MSLTPQRLAIYEALVGSADHPTPEILWDRVRTLMPTLSLATIYKTLEALARLGLVSELPATGQCRRFDANMAPHHHLVCTGCGRVADFWSHELSTLAVPRGIPGFRARRVDVHVQGVCDDCARPERVTRERPSTKAAQEKTKR